jgi:DNA-binding response OmpR family regulator
MKILLLEDTLSLNKAITQILDINGHEVLSFTDGQEAMNNITSHIDLYLLDITVPNINGLELLTMIKNYNQYSKVIIMSADTSINTLSLAYKNGCIDFLKKPFDVKELQLKISRFAIVQNELLSSIKFRDSINSLTLKEKKLLELLVNNRNEIVSMEEIEEFVYAEITMTTDAARSLVKRLRSKLIDPNCIKTMPYQGYMYMDL